MLNEVYHVEDIGAASLVLPKREYLFSLSVLWPKECRK